MAAHYVLIINVKAQLRSSNDRAPFLNHLYPISHYVLFDVSLVGDYFELLYSGQKFARLNKDFCREIRQLTRFGVKFQAYLSKSDWASLFPTRSNYPTSPAVSFDVEVNVYSFKHHADQIGDILAQAGVFLQDPTHDSNEVPYHNPQLLEIQGIEEREETPVAFAEGPALNLISFGSTIEQEKADPERQSKTTDLVDSILDSLSHNGILQEISTDQNRIKTKLLPYAHNIHKCRSCTLLTFSDIK